MGPRVDLDIQRARDGDPRAFRAIIDRLQPGLTRYVTYFLRGDLHAANDVVQEAFVEAWRRLDRLHTMEHLRPWLYHVAKCKAVSWLRRRAPPGTRFEPIDGFLETREEIPSRVRPPSPRGIRDPDRWDFGALRRALDALPSNYAAVVELHYLHGFDTRETARLLDLPRTTVKMRLHRARKSLRRSLEPPHPTTSRSGPPPKEVR